MRNLIRALKMSFRYRWSIAGGMFCSFLVALLWGANIGVVLPFVEVIFKQQSLHDWIDARVTQAAESYEKAQAQVTELQTQLGSAKAEERGRLQRELTRCNNQAESEQKKLATARQIAPWVKQYLPTDPFQTLLYMAGFVVIGTFLRGLALMGNMVLVARVGQRTVLDLQNAFFRRTLQMELNAPGATGTGDLVGRIRGETGAIGTAVTTLYGKTFREPMKMIACLIGAAWFNWRLLMFSLIVAPVAGALLVLLARYSRRANKRAFEESAKLSNRLFQALQHIKVVKAFSMESHERLRFRRIADDVRHKGMRIAVYSALARMNNELLGVSITALAFVAGGYLVLTGDTHFLGIQLGSTSMSFAEMMAFFAFLVGASDPLRKMTDVYSLLQAGMVAADRVFPLIDRIPAVQTPANPAPFPRGRLGIEFRGLRFAYRPEYPVLNDFNLRIEPGSSVAILGPNGCGKSTLVNLLPRFFDAQEGTILINGVDTREFRLKDLRRAMGYVTQQTMLFDDTIANNIRYGTPNASDEEVIEAARKAHAHSFILSHLERGYETTIGEAGGKLSGGQRQRIALARAILRNPPLLLLDEATSQIDPESEILIHQTLSEFIRGRTTILITHRLTTLELADTIVVMDAGRVVDCGSHDQLLRRCETYRKLRNSDVLAAA